jgi:LacI family transcriptional regulator
MRQATIRDVARQDNVSVASVSRTSNGHSNVNAATRERVLQAVRDLGYVPNAAARSLSMALSHTIGVVVPDLHGEFFSELIRGMDGAARAAGYQLLLSTMHADVAEARHALAAMHGRVDGLIVMAAQIDPAELNAMLPASLPVVLLNGVGGGDRSWFAIDNRAGAAAVADHFAALGRRSILHIMGPEANVDARERRDGFAAALKRSAPGASLTVMPGDFGEESGRAAVADGVERQLTFDAIFAANDMMALGAMQELQRRSIDVPDKVAVAGFDDIPMARFLGLTTMRVRMDEIGKRAVEALTTALDEPGRAVEQERLVPELVVRASTTGERQ